MIRFSRLATVFGLACLAALTGCARNKTDLSVNSLVADAALRPVFPTRAYIPTDRNTCDIYLSDIPAGRLADPTDSLADVAGNIIHIHIFLMPKAGQTPIDSSACNITVQHVILAPGGAVGGEDLGTLGGSGVSGLYAGGGFCLPSGAAGDATFGGDLLDATMRLARATPGFADRLGPARVAGSFAAPRNDELSRAISARIETISRFMSEVAKD